MCLRHPISFLNIIKNMSYASQEKANIKGDIMATFNKHSQFLASLAKQEAKGVIDTAERVLYTASKNKGTVVKGVAGAIAFNKGLETDSWVLKGAGLCLLGSALLDSKKLKEDFNSFDIDTALEEMLKEEEFEQELNDEFDNILQTADKDNDKKIKEAEVA